MSIPFKLYINDNYYIYFSESITDETVTTTNVETVDDIDKLKCDLCLIDDSFEKFIVGVTNHEALLVHHYTSDLNNASMSTY